MALHGNFELANQRARELQDAIPKAVSAHYDRKSGHIVVGLSSRLILSFSPQDAQGLENAKASQLEEIEITPSGFGIHFPKLDADLYVPGLLEGLFRLKEVDGVQARSTWRTIQKQGQKMASKVNGRLGGRPRKAVQG